MAPAAATAAAVAAKLSGLLSLTIWSKSSTACACSASLPPRRRRTRAAMSARRGCAMAAVAAVVAVKGSGAACGGGAGRRTVGGSGEQHSAASGGGAPSQATHATNQGSSAPCLTLQRPERYRGREEAALGGRRARARRRAGLGAKPLLLVRWEWSGGAREYVPRRPEGGEHSRRESASDLSCGARSALRPLPAAPRGRCNSVPPCLHDLM